MRIIVSDSNDPYFNIATEEYILKNFNEDIFFLYINLPSIICGKHQNPIAETNFQYILKNNIPIIRRLSGGGTVYHDLGNLNFCFIQSNTEQKLVDFVKFTKPIIEVLQSMGLDARLGDKNDIRINSIKVSGNAEHVWKNRVLHHGTLLFSSDLIQLVNSLSEDDSSFHSKAVKSNRGKVANISDFLKEKISIEQFQNKIKNHLLERDLVGHLYSFTPFDRESIKSLANDKYSSWEWNFAYSPNYVHHTLLVGEGIKVILQITNGIVTTCETDMSLVNTSEFEIVGKKHSELLKDLIIR